MKKSKFNLTHSNPLTLDPGYLVPFLLQPTLPNDTFRIGLANFIRAQPMLAPLMHEVKLYTQYWFVPLRLLWDEWEDFITGGEDLSSTPAFPTITSTADDAKAGTLWDYFGFPLVEGVEVSAMPFRAMAEIWNTRYRDEDLQQELPISYGSGPDTTTSRELLSPAFAKDYFTVARPFTQRGGDVFVPVYNDVGGVSPTGRRVSFSVIAFHHTIINTGSSLGTLKSCDLSYNFNDVNAALLKWFEDNQANIENLILSMPPYGSTQADRDFFTADVMTPRLFYQSLNSTYTANGSDVDVGWYFYVFIDSVQRFESDTPVQAGIITPAFTTATCPSQITGSRTTGNPTTYPFYNGYSVPSSVAGATINTFNWDVVKLSGVYNYADLRAGAAGMYIRDLRSASAMQRYAERSLKYGNRYEEFIQREFGIKPRDYRIQRPEYLGGGSGILNISEVLQTAESTDTGVGTMRGHGMASVSQRRIRFKCPEHGLILGLISIRPKSLYTQGVDREWLKRSRLDFFTPELASIGMQEVLQQEIFATANNQKEIFGYSDRYQEYRYHKPIATGEFRTNLNFWTMARLFQNPPNLNAEFIDMSYSIDDFKRPFQVQDDSAHAFVAMIVNTIRAYRPIPKRAKDILR